MDDIAIDPEFRDLVPKPSDEERALLEAKLLAEGCRDPLVRWKGRRILLDGHNRYGCCQKHGITYAVVDIDLTDRDAAKLWIRENQLGRRNLTDDQRAAIAYDVAQMRAAVSKRERASKAADSRHNQSNNMPCSEDTAASKQKHQHEKPPSPRARAEAAKEARVSERKLKAVANLAKDDPSVVQEIAAGTVSIAQAKKAAKAKQATSETLAEPNDLEDIDELEAATCNATAKNDPEQPWAQYNATLTRLAATIHDAVLGIRALAADKGQVGVFASWIDARLITSLKNWALVFEGQRITNWASTQQQATLPSIPGTDRPRNFLYESDKPKGKRKRGA